jgi:hypothetical protein
MILLFCLRETIWRIFINIRCKLQNIYSVIVEQKKLEGFDLIFTRIPEISLYQILLFIGASYTIIVSGQVQTGSVFLNAKPEQYRCKNKLDSFPDATYQNAHFASGKFYQKTSQKPIKAPRKYFQKPTEPHRKITRNRPKTHSKIYAGKKSTSS